MNRFGHSVFASKLLLATVLILPIGALHAQQQGAQQWGADGCVYQFHGRQWVKTNRCQSAAEKQLVAQQVQQIQSLIVQINAAKAAQTAQARARQPVVITNDNPGYFVIGGGSSSSPVSSTSSRESTFTLGSGGCGGICALNAVAARQNETAVHLEQDWLRKNQDSMTPQEHNEYALKVISRSAAQQRAAQQVLRQEDATRRANEAAADRSRANSAWARAQSDAPILEARAQRSAAAAR